MKKKSILLYMEIKILAKIPKSIFLSCLQVGIYFTYIIKIIHEALQNKLLSQDIFFINFKSHIIWRFAENPSLKWVISDIYTYIFNSFFYETHIMIWRMRGVGLRKEKKNSQTKCAFLIIVISNHFRWRISLFKWFKWKVLFKRK